MKGIGRKGAVAALTVGMLLSSCAHRKTAAIETAPARAAEPRPVLAASLAAVVPPPLGPDGRYRTINTGLDPIQTEWHVRAALNVAAIGCRGAGDGALIDAYNQMLRSQKAELARANSRVEATFRAGGGDWQSAHDAYMTRLYNFFSQPAGKAAFCAEADRIAPHAAAPEQGFQAFAAEALPRLEAPFIETYRQVDAYKLALAEWQAGRTVRLAAATRAPAAPRLGYADMRALFAWQPAAGVRLAAR